MWINGQAVPPRWRRGTACLPYLALLAAAYSVFCVTTDDPFITYRYAANIWAGHGPVFNVGERVEGFSSPLHLLLMVLLLKIAPSTDILFKAKLLGLAFAALAVWLTGKLGNEAGLSPSEAWLAQMLVGLNTNFAVAAVNGMETTLYACLILAALRAGLREMQTKAGLRSALWLFLAWTARPDALGVFALLWLVRLVWTIRLRRPWHELVLWTIVFLLPTLALTLLRLLYYGQLVPNTYFAKNVTLAVGWNDGLAYLLHPLFPTPLYWSTPVRWAIIKGQAWPLLGLSVFWALALIGMVRLLRTWTGGVFLAVIAAMVAFVLRFGGDWMPGWRFLAPAVPLLAVLQCHGLRALRFQRVRWAAPALAAALWAVCAVVVPHDPWSNARFSSHGGALLSADNTLGRKWVAVNRYLRTAALPGSLIAYSEMGYAGYENMDLRFIDVRGLTDPEIARLPAQYKGPWGVDDDEWFQPHDPLGAILARRQPDMIIAFSSARQMPSLALGCYYFVRYVGDPHDPPRVIFPALVYRRVGSPD